MIHFFFGDKQVSIQLIPIYGLSLGVLYYDPNLEPDQEEEVEEYFQQITVMFIFFGIHITIL
jgi:hypothetical protein